MDYEMVKCLYCKYARKAEIKKKYGFDNSLIHKCCKGQYKNVMGIIGCIRSDFNEV